MPGLSCSASIAAAAFAVVAALAPTPVARAQGLKTFPVMIQKSTPTPYQKIVAQPTINSVEPTGCVKTGARVTLVGTAFGATKPSSHSLAVQAPGGALKVVVANSWSSTRITFVVPATAGLRAGTGFAAGIHNGTAFVANTVLTLCAATGTPSVGTIRLPGGTPSLPPVGVKGSTLPVQMNPVLRIPTITSASPQSCLKAGDQVTLAGANFGDPKPADFALAIQVGSGTPRPLAARSWSATRIVFKTPSGLPAGSSFQAGILSGGVLVASTKLTSCGASLAGNGPADYRPRIKRPIRPGGPRPAPPRMPEGDSDGTPWIYSFSPDRCVNVGDVVSAIGENLGTSKETAGISLGMAVWRDEQFEVEGFNWSPTSISFVVDPEAGSSEWFILGFFKDSEWFPCVVVCTNYTYDPGEDYIPPDDPGYSPPWPYGDEPYGDYDYDSGYTPGPKGARMLGPGSVNIQIEPSPPPVEETADQPPPSGRPAVGGKLLAMKALNKRGLRKVNRECDLYDPHCPCCRKDDSVCLEKESDNEDGTSTWTVRWVKGARTADGEQEFGANSAEDDVEAITGLECEPDAGGGESGVGVATLICR